MLIKKEKGRQGDKEGWTKRGMVMLRRERKRERKREKGGESEAKWTKKGLRENAEMLIKEIVGKEKRYKR